MCTYFRQSKVHIKCTFLRARFIYEIINVIDMMKIVMIMMLLCLPLKVKSDDFILHHDRFFRSLGSSS